MTELSFRQYIKGKKVALAGAGVSNMPLIGWLSSMGAEVTVRDRREELSGIYEAGAARAVLGAGYLDGITEDIIFRSPGMRPDIPELAAAVERGAKLTSEIELLFELCPAHITAVTGSDGKTTTTTLISKLLETTGRRVFLGGNIGTPLCSRVFEMTAADEVVLELSSFQLQTMKQSPAVAVVTNLAPNHLDKHKSFEEYIDSKKNIFLNQDKNGLLVINADNEITAGFEKEAKGRAVTFCRSGRDRSGIWLSEKGIICDGETPLLDRKDILLPGDHNVENYMAAIAATRGRVTADAVKSLASSFSGVRHRLEFVREKDGVKYYNDSIGTSPSRSTAGLLSFENKLILIAGGYDKHLDYTDFGKTVAERVKLLIITGDTAPKIKAAVVAADPSLPVIECDGFDKTVAEAAAHALPGDTVLLSPASASFDKFKNFEERGDRFTALVKAL